MEDSKQEQLNEEKDSENKGNEEKLNKENDINQINETEIKKETEVNEDNKRIEIDTNSGVNYLNTKSDFNLTTSFEDFENKIQELKEKINKNKMGNTFNITNSNNKNFSGTRTLNVNKLNDNSMTRNKLRELFNIIGGPGKSNGRTSAMNNKPPVKFNILNPPINSKKFYSKISSSAKKTNYNTNNRLNFKSTPVKKNIINNEIIGKNTIPNKSFGYSTFYSKKNNNNMNTNKYKSTNKGKNPINYFKPIVVNSIRNTSFNKQDTKKKENIFNKKYYRGELDNFNYLLFGNSSSKKKYGKKDEEVIDPFFNPPDKSSSYQKSNFRTIDGGDNFFSSKYTGVNTNVPKINKII